MARIRRCTTASIAGADAEFGSKSSRRWRDRRSRPSKWRWTARTSKRTAAPAAEKGGGGTGDRRHQGRPEQQDSWAADKLCRPWVLILTPGNTADCTVAPACVSLLDGIRELLGDKA